MQTRLTFLSALSSFTRLGSLLGRRPTMIARTSGKAKNSDAGNQDNRFEAAMKHLHIHSTERRRTARVALALPLVVQGQTEMNEKFSVKTITQSVGGHGGLITLDIPVVVGQTLVLVNDRKEQEAECRIVSIRKGGDRKTYVGFEFVAPQCNFWHMTFTAPGARPLRRVIPIRISA